MAYSREYPDRLVEERTTIPVVEYRDRVRWGPILAGLAIALCLQLVLSALGTAIGANGISNSGAPRTNADDVARAVGIWSIISLLLSLFFGGLVTSRASGPLNRNTALLNGAVLWAATLIVGAFLISSGVSGTFGLVASNAGEIINQVQESGANLPDNAPNVTAQQTRDIAGNISKVSGSFALGSLFGLIASLIGSSLGNTRHKNVGTNTVAEHKV